MMRIRFIFITSIKHISYNIKSSLVVLISLTICICSIFLMAEALLYSNSFLENAEINKRTYSVEVIGRPHESDKTYAIFNELINGDTLPKISSFSGIYVNPVIDENVEEYISASVYFEDDPRYSVDMDIVDGRSFTTEEILSGANVVIISKNLNYWKSNNPYRVGDQVLINNTPYEIIGIDRNQSYITKQNVLNNQNFVIYFDKIQFAEKLDSEAEIVFKEVFAPIGGNPVSRFSQLVAEFAMHVVTYIALIGLVSYCALSIIAQLFSYMVNSRRYEYNIYRVLGIDLPMLVSLYYTPILLLSFAAGALAFLVYKYTEPLQCYIGMEKTLEALVCGICYMIIAVVLLLVTLPNFIRLKRQSAIETR